MEEITARQNVLSYLATRYPTLALEITLTLRRPYGWAFCYQNSDYLKTRFIGDALVGAGPLLVLKADGRLIELGTAHPASEELDHYAVSHGLA